MAEPFPGREKKIMSFPSAATLAAATKEAGAVDLAAALAAPDVERLDKDRRINEMVRETMSPAGSLGLPKLLDERRMEYAIPDAVFEEHAVYDRVLIWQIQVRFLEKKARNPKKGMIEFTENWKKLQQHEAPRGVIVTAGLLALDAIRSNGMDLGHVVNFGRLAPFAKIVDEIGGHQMPLLIMSAGDIISSEDLPRMLKDRTVRVKFDEETQQHLFVDENGKSWKPILPPMDPAS